MSNVDGNLRPLERRAFVVVGMHRSGTSAMTRTLSLLGAALPKGLMLSHEDNPTGFWEPQSVADLNDEILQALDSEWDDVFSFRPRNYLSNFDRFYVGRAVELLHQEFNGSQVVVLKDPRISVLTSFWDRALREAGYDPHYVVMVRNPLEVAESLRARDAFPQEKSLLLWSSYMLALDRDTREQKRTFVAFEQLMTGWRTVRDRLQSDAELPFFRDTPAAAIEIDRFIDGRLRHHEVSAEDLAARMDVPEAVKALYRIFSAACDGGEIDHAAIDEVRLELERIDALVGPVVADLSGRLKGLARGVAELQQAHDAHAERANSLAARLAEVEAERDRLSDDINAKTSEASDLGSRICGLESERDQLIADLETKKSEAAELAGRIAATESERDFIAAEGRQAAEDFDRRVENLNTELTRWRQTFEEQESRGQELSDELRELKGAHERLLAQRLDLEREFASASSESSRLLKAAEAYGERQAKMHTETKSELEKAQAVLVANERQLSERYQELATLSQLLGAQERRNREVRDQVEWLASFNERLRTQPGWWSLMPVSWRRAREARRLKAAMLFDGEAYLAANPDVAAHGFDPLQHYLSHGIYEGRQRA